VSQQDNSPASDPSSKNPTQNNNTDDKGGDTDGIALRRKRKREACLGSGKVNEFLAFHTDLVIKCLGDEHEGEARTLRACVLLLASQGDAEFTNHQIANMRTFTNGNSELKDALDMMETCSRGFGC
jgi:hypothetical protein